MVKFLDIKLILKTILILFFIIFVSYKMQSQINSNPENEFSLINMPDSLQANENNFTRDRVVIKINI